jgi:cytochrome c peroxidase
MKCRAWLSRRRIALVAGSAIAVCLLPLWRRHEAPPAARERAARMFDRWSQVYEREQHFTRTPIPLRFVRGWSPRFTEASGLVEINFQSGHLAATVERLEPLPAGAAYEIWLVDNRPGPRNTALIDQGPDGDAIQRLGTLDASGSWAGSIEPARLADLRADMAAVMRCAPGAEPAFVIGGLQSIYFQINRQARLGRGPQPESAAVQHAGLFPALFAQVSEGPSTDDDPVTTLADMIDLGQELFDEEAFDGNGRTCATCHPASNFGTIDAEFIRELPSDDPLFVFETNPDLVELENRKMLRGPRALVLENLAGFENPPVFRSTPGLFNLGPTAPYGWSGVAGDLQSFAIGAVFQHFPKTLARVPAGFEEAGEEPDFRVPDPAELAAMEAFMLSVSFPDDTPSLADFDLTDKVVARGRALFFSPEKRCSGCHNSPVLSNGASRFFDTGVVFQPENKKLPLDLGAGMHAPPGNPPPPNFVPGAFDTPQLLGVALTPPFFHDNSALTLRQAVEFYRTDAFNNSPARNGGSGQPIELTGREINDITAFLEAVSR